MILPPLAPRPWNCGKGTAVAQRVGRVRRTPTVDQEIVDLHARGYTVDAIAEAYGTGWITIRRVLTTAGRRRPCPHCDGRGYVIDDAAP